jgi:starch synthase
MKILFAASEVAPFAKTGGLADVAGSLPRALASLGHDVRVVLPRYRQIDSERLGLRSVSTFYVPLGSWKERCDILAGSLGRDVTAYFVSKDVYYDRPGLYGTSSGDYPDNAERFIFFSRAIPELCRALDFSPDIIHCNDWETGLVPLYVKRLYGSVSQLAGTRTVFTIHNLGYQGIFWHWDFPLTGLGWDVFTPEGIEYWGNMSLLKAGIVFADSVTTVSATYAREIQTVENGLGLDGVLRNRAADLVGIVNGIDYDDWDPARDAAIAAHFSAARLAGKRVCRAALLQELGLSESQFPVIGMVTRLTDQKGIDILVDALSAILKRGVRLVILGTGDERYHRILTDVARLHAGKMRVLLTYDEALARRIYAGSDIFLMPSRYEPCGLGQMHALRYGTVPIVRRTGGLADTVVDHDPRSSRGTGFLFDEYSGVSLAKCVRRTADVYEHPAEWKRIMRSGMRVDLSWAHSAKGYENVYRKLLRKE